MDALSRSDLQALMQVEHGPCISIYLPTTRTSNKEKRQDAIRLKNLLRQAENGLVKGQVTQARAQELLAPVRDLLDDSGFWESQSDGLAALLWPDDHRVFRLPLELQELVVVAPRLHLKPLLPLLDRSDTFFVLALSQKHLKLYRANHQGLERVSPGKVPDNMDEALQLDEAGKGREFRAGTAAGATPKGASFHGQGSGTDSIEHKKDILRYFQMVDSALVAGPLRNQTSSLILTGPEFLHSIYREANSYQNLYPGELHVHSDGVDEAELHRRLMGLVKPAVEERKKKALAMLEQLSGTGKASERLEEVISAAYSGRVQFLFVPIEVQRWGSFDSSSHAVTVHEVMEPFDYDLLDFAAAQTVLHDGTIFVMTPHHMPNGSLVAAIFRY